MKSYKNNTGFICKACNHHTLPHPTSSRNHCTHCLSSLHVDITPGDRQNTCLGIMHPIQLSWNSQKGEQIVFQCASCGMYTKCISSEDDNPEILIHLRKKPLYTS